MIEEQENVLSSEPWTLKPGERSPEWWRSEGADYSDPIVSDRALCSQLAPTRSSAENPDYS